MPGSHCCVKNCSNRSHDGHGKLGNNGLQFFRLPKWKKLQGEHCSDLTRRRRMAWLAAIRRKDLTFDHTPQSRVCSLHFHSVEALETTPRWGRSKTLPDASLSKHSDQPASRSRTLTRQQSLDVPEKVAGPVEKGHFVDRHRSELIERVSYMFPILDHLLQEQVLGQEQYDRVVELRPHQAQMRFLFGGPLKTAGDRAKDVLMSAICIHYPSLVQDLWKKEG